MRLDRTYADYTNNLMLSLLNTVKKIDAQKYVQRGNGSKLYEGTKLYEDNFVYIFDWVKNCE